MKRHLFIILFTFSRGLSFAQGFNWQWTEGAWGPTGQVDIEGWAVATDKNYNVYATGFFDGPYLTFGDSIVHSYNSGMNNYLVKYSDQGSVLWVKSSVYPGTVQTAVFGLAVACDGNGNVYNAGVYYG
ncbi:MAG: hypothetical protein JWO06_3138, partial [Bacteroidota bacterium]|nr:hypothetical protein [Bacteroidota bacterium]